MCEHSNYRAYTVTIGNVDIPAYMANGVIYLQTPLGLIFEAFGENISDFVRDMEIRVSGQGSATLSPDDIQRSIHGAKMALKGLV